MYGFRVKHLGLRVLGFRALGLGSGLGLSVLDFRVDSFGCRGCMRHRASCYLTPQILERMVHRANKSFGAGWFLDLCVQQ